VNNSGVINYLNKFGKLTTGDYKRTDPVSELYYAATRYFRNQGNVPTYTSLAGAADQATLAKWIDGFPVIRTWTDPMQYSCQKNFILGIGDVYTHRDQNLPGSTMPADPLEPAVPAAVSADTSVNVKTATDMVGQLQGISNLGSARTGSGGGTAATYFIAGLAYDAHTKDIRSDLNGTQTISTYWLDVRENQTYVSKNQYWLAAKYGGFDVPSGFDPYATANGTTTLADNLWTLPGQTVGSDSRPSNYFIASDPAVMVSSLRAAFARIASENEAASTTAFSTTTAKVSRTGTASYATQYSPRDWTGDVVASEITFNQYGVPELTTRWNAGALLNATSPGSRKIVTCCTSAGAALPFRATDLSTATLNARTNYSSFSNVPGVTGTQTASNYVDYLRGVRTMETSYSGGVYRSRTSVLGDIVGSRANPVGRPTFPYADLFNPGYSAFKNTHANRKTVVYVGANDGMLHAFGGTLPVSGSCPTGGSCGNELFAYVPSFVYGSTNAIAATQGLASLGNPNFQHRYLVDGTAQNFDVDFFNTPSPTATAPDWRTMLIGGLGKGGNGYFALDITNPNDWTSETAVASKALWEFTDSRMGNTFGEAIVVKTRKYGWTVVVPSGYNNSDGVGYLFLIHPRTGALLDAIATPEGSTSAPINLAHANAFVPSFRDFTTDAIYAGDLRGNLWRFDLTAASGTYPQATKIATLTDASGNPQPVTTKPLIELDPSSNKRYVVVATGRLLADSDISSTQRQTLYVIADGTSGAGEFYTSTTLPTAVAFPIGRGELNNNSNPLAGIGSTPTRVMGWYVDLIVPTSGPAERVNTDMTANLGSVLAAVNQPDGQACQGGGIGRLLGLRLSDGRTVLTQENTTTSTTDLVASRSVNSVISNISFLTVNGQTRAYYGTSRSANTGSTPSTGLGSVTPTTRCGSSGAGGKMDCTDLDSGGAVVRRLNWREVQTAN
jgi:type IV pilus assembly protein PilY1